MRNNKSILKESKSGHIFMWPFTGLDKNAKYAIDENLLIKHGWERNELYLDGYVDYDDLKTKFSCLQYLNESAKKIFSSIPSTDHICKQFKIPNKLLTGYQYNIEFKGKTYSLNIESIELHLYNFNIGILMITTSNDKYCDIEEIKLINDLSRRVSMPYLPSDLEISTKNQSLELSTPDRVYISKNEDVLYDYNYRDYFLNKDTSNSRFTPQELFDMSHPMPLLMYILNNVFDDLHAGKGIDERKYEIRVKEFNDDRMFLMCFIRDDELSRQLQGPFDSSIKNLLYSIIYVDPSYPTCQNEEMRDALLEQALYKRWSNFGTIHAATNYSFFLLTSNDSSINDSVIRPFVYEYKYFISLVLAQRFGLLLFSEKALSFAELKSTKINAIHLKEQYCKFENQILLPEISNQDQGIDVYHLLQKQLYIKEGIESLDRPIKDLGELASFKIDKIKNYILLTISLLGFSFGGYGIAIDIIESPDKVLSVTTKILILGFFMIISIIIFIIFVQCDHKRKKYL